MREPNGASGNRSLLRADGARGGGRRVAFWMIYYDRYNPETATDERIVITMLVGVGLAFFADRGRQQGA